MNEFKTPYLHKLRSKYNLLNNSRVVVKGDKDKEALDYFQNHLNAIVFSNESEYELTVIIRTMYWTDKMSFNRCARKEPCLILLTEARNIVVHFKIQDIVFIQWVNGEYQVQENDIVVISDKSHNKNKYDKKRNNKKYNNLEERIDNIETTLKIKSSDVSNSDNEKSEKVENTKNSEKLNNEKVEKTENTKNNRKSENIKNNETNKDK